MVSFAEDATDDRGGDVSCIVQVTGGEGNPEDLPIFAEWRYEYVLEPARLSLCDEYYWDCLEKYTNWIWDPDGGGYVIDKHCQWGVVGLNPGNIACFNISCCED